MRVFVYSSGADTGGQGWRIGEAFRKLADPMWPVDVLHGHAGSLGYPEHLALLSHRRGKAAQSMYDAADVVHLRNNLAGRRRFDRGQEKPTVLHHHGTTFRNNPARMDRQARAIGAVQVASTLDLTLLAPNIEWLPTPFDLDELAAIRAAHQRIPYRVTIGHFPTDPTVKSTPAFMAATRRLAERYEIRVLTNAVKVGGDRWAARAGTAHGMGWADVLAQKARCDVLFDQVLLGYGNNAIEAWGMGIPVIAGVANPVVRALMIERFGQLPFVEATPDTIEETLERLICSAAMRKEWGQIGLEHARRFHSEAAVIPLLQQIWRSAKPTQPAELMPSWMQTRLDDVTVMTALQAMLRSPAHQGCDCYGCTIARDLMLSR